MTRPNRGQIWLVRFDPSLGGELKKERPAVIMTEEGMGILPLQIAVPVTAWNPNYSGYPWMVHLVPEKKNGLTKDSAADAFQVKSVSEKRLVKQMGILEEKNVENIAAAIAICVGYA